MDDDVGRQRLIKFVSKLSDRAIQQQNSSGFTVWAIIGASLLVTSHIIFNAYALPKSTEVKDVFIFILTAAYDFAFVVFLFFFASFLLYKKSYRYTSPNQESSLRLIKIFPPKLTLALCFALNLYCTYDGYKFGFPFWPYLIFAGYFAVDVLLFLTSEIKNIVIHFRPVLARPGYVIVDELTVIKSLRYGTFNGILLFGVSLLLTVWLTIAFKTISVGLPPQTTRLLIETSCEIVLINGMVLLLFFQVHGLHRNAQLQRLEADIYLENLSFDAIKDRLQSELFGYKPLDWITSEKRKYERFAEDSVASLSSVEKLLDEDDFDPSRLKSETHMVLSALKQYERTRLNTLAKIRALKGSEIDQEEARSLGAFADDFERIDKTVRSYFSRVLGRLETALSNKQVS